MQKKVVYLHGHLREKFGEKFEFYVHSPSEMIRALCSQVKAPHFNESFKDVLKEGWYKILRGKFEIDTNELALNFGVVEEMHIVPVMMGSSKNGTMGVGKIVLGVAVIAAAAILTPGGIGGALYAGTLTAPVIGSVTAAQVAMIGVGIALSGVATLLTPTQKPTSSTNQVNGANNFLFNGAVNTSTQGVPIPLVYGQFAPGSVVIASGLVTQDVPVGS